LIRLLKTTNTPQVVNDDGPPSSQSSPYVYDLVKTLQSSNHTVSVVLPHTQRSWIAKAHIVGQTIKPTYYRPSPVRFPDHSHADKGDTGTTPLPKDSKEEEWILVDSTPASCVQIGLFHYFKERGNVDLVISGPNYGRNTTSVFALSSGTLGGALEAAGVGKRAIALSFAFKTREHDAEIIHKACKMSVRIIEKLVAEWDENVHVYSINVPLEKGVEETKVLWTKMLQNTWKSSCFTEVEVAAEDDDGPVEDEMRIRLGESNAKGEDENEVVEGSGHLRYTHKHFKWAPKFTDVYQSVEDAPHGNENDGWVVREGFVRSVSFTTLFFKVINRAC
jgi:tubulin--tyrosine ligase